MGSIPGSERPSRGGNAYPLQYSFLENFMDRGAWWATVHGVAKSQTWLSTHTHTDTHKDYTIMDFTEWVNFLTDLTSFKVEWTQCHERGLNCNHYKNKCFLNMISPADCFPTVSSTTWMSNLKKSSWKSLWINKIDLGLRVLCLLFKLHDMLRFPPEILLSLSATHLGCLLWYVYWSSMLSSSQIFPKTKGQESFPVNFDILCSLDILFP